MALHNLRHQGTEDKLQLQNVNGKQQTVVNKEQEANKHRKAASTLHGKQRSGEEQHNHLGKDKLSTYAPIYFKTVSTACNNYRPAEAIT